MVRQQRSRPLLPIWLVVALFVTVLASAVFVLFVLYFSVEAYLAQPFNPLDGSPLPELVEVDGELPDAEVTEGRIEIPEDPVAIQATIDAAMDVPEDDGERITILVMGIDRRPGDPFVSRTDSMMLMSMNPKTKEAAVLSIPRDLWVEIPGYGRNRVNTAFVRGAVADGNSPQAGAELAMQTVSLNLGVHIDHYLLIDFSAFVNAIDAIGGIEVNVPVAINDPTYPDMNYGFDPLFIPAGVNRFDGRTALKYARTRHQDSDFGRSERQQQVLLAVRDQIIANGVNITLTQLPTLYAQVESGIRTDLSYSTIVSLATVSLTLPQENIQQAVLDTNYVVPTVINGAQVLVLQNDKAAPLIREMFVD